MREFEDIVSCIKEGSLFRIIGKDEKPKYTYYGYLTEYDGDMISEVKNIRIAKFLCRYRYIMENINENNTFKLTYDRECKVYISSITTKDINAEACMFIDKNMDTCINKLDQALYDKGRARIKMKTMCLGEKYGK